MDGFDTFDASGVGLSNTHVIDSDDEISEVSSDPMQGHKRRSRKVKEKSIRKKKSRKPRNYGDAGSETSEDRYNRFRMQQTRGRKKKNRQGDRDKNRRRLQSTISRISMALTDYDENDELEAPDKSHILLGTPDESAILVDRQDGIYTGQGTLMVRETDVPDLIEQAKQFGSNVQLEVVKEMESEMHKVVEEDSGEKKTSCCCVFFCIMCLLVTLAAGVVLVLYDTILEFFEENDAGFGDYNETF